MRCQWTMAAALIAAASGPALASDVTGTWLRQEGAVRVKIGHCGSTVCGTVVWLKDPNGPGKVGQRVFYDMIPADAGNWVGTAFNPEDGQTYSGTMVASGRQLITTGCAFGGLICKSYNWSKVE